MNHIERLLYNLKWKRFVWRYGGTEYCLSYASRRPAFQFRRFKQGFALSKLFFWGDPVCEVCNSADGDTRCAACCEHEFDMSEGGMCLNCDAEADWGRMIDAAEIQYGPDR